MPRARVKAWEPGLKPLWPKAHRKWRPKDPRKNKFVKFSVSEDEWCSSIPRGIQRAEDVVAQGFFSKVGGWDNASDGVETP
jgi:hypothetical protein